MIYRQCLY